MLCKGIMNLQGKAKKVREVLPQPPAVELLQG
jgi:hypothetical protein